MYVSPENRWLSNQHGRKCFSCQHCFSGKHSDGCIQGRLTAILASGDLKNAFLQAGREVLESERGSAGFDLRLVARKAGLSHAAPYRHFSDKRALIAASVEAGLKELKDRMAERLAAAGKASASERLRVVAIT